MGFFVVGDRLMEEQKALNILLFRCGNACFASMSGTRMRSKDGTDLSGERVEEL